MRIQKTYASIAASTNAYGAALTAASGVALPLTATTPGDNLGHTIIITPTGSVTGNYGISGYDADGQPISETLATNTTNAVTSLKFYATGIAITAPAGLGAETVSAGPTAASRSAAVNMQPGNPRMFSNYGISCDITGTPTFTLQQSYGGNWYDHAVIAAKSADTAGSILYPVMALRLTFSAAGTVALNVIAGQ